VNLTVRVRYEDPSCPPVDIEKAKLLGVSIDDVSVALQSTFGACCVNDFNRDDRVYRVQMQSDARFRAHREDLREISVRAAGGAMIPLTAIAAAVQQITGPDFIERFNLFRSARLSGGPAQDYSSGQALAVIENVAAQTLPTGYTLGDSRRRRSRRRRPVLEPIAAPRDRALVSRHESQRIVGFPHDPIRAFGRFLVDVHDDLIVIRRRTPRSTPPPRYAFTTAEHKKNTGSVDLISGRTGHLLPHPPPVIACLLPSHFAELVE
jgi:hypothetical protein